MTKAELFYADGSPFARLCRVLVLDWQLAVSFVEVPHPLPDDFFDQNPLGQVPLLKTVGETIFPTLPIVEQLWAMTQTGDLPQFDPMMDRPKLAAIFALYDVLIAARQIEWSGLQPGGENRLGYDVHVRHLERVQHMLDWLETRVDPNNLGVCEYAIAILLLWAESRGPIEWRARENLVALVENLQERPSFVSTAPKAWAGRKA